MLALRSTHKVLSPARPRYAWRTRLLCPAPSNTTSQLQDAVVAQKSLTAFILIDLSRNSFVYVVFTSYGFSTPM